jgi:hypothetical protein
VGELNVTAASQEWDRPKRMKAMINLFHICKQATIVMVICLSLASAMVWAAPALKNSGAEEGGQYEPMDRVSIEKKMIDAVVTNVGEVYELDEQTIITGMDGKQVSIRKMLVPCEAEVTYDTKQGKRIARRIRITRVHDKARWQWGARRPE